MYKLGGGSGIWYMEVASARKTLWRASYLALLSVLPFLVSLLLPATGIPHSSLRIHGNASRGGSGPTQEERMIPRYVADLLRRLSFPPVPGERNIFFVESSCAIKKFPNPTFYDSKSGLRLSPRGACAVEAAAAAHPTHRVYLVHTCQVRRRSLAKGAAPAYALAALSAPNVRLWAVPYARHYVGTPLHDWLARGALRASHWPVVHASDVLRFLLLWKYGGTYLDLDVLMLRSLGDRRNFGCPENNNFVSVGAINFALDATGRRFANACIEELRDFHTNRWVYGARAITRAVKKVCGIKKINEITKEKCGDFHLLATSTFYSIPWLSWTLLFKEEGAKETMNMIGNNLAVHVWNAKSKVATVNTSSMQPYAQIARRVCPKVVAVVGKTM